MPTVLTPANPPEVFISYSHKDEHLLEGLEVHLKALKNQGIINFWHGRRISPGDDWEKEIDKHLSTAQIILLLVSPDFLASDYCYGVEFKRAMERHEGETARVIPVILRPCNWRDTPLGKFYALPKGAIPVVNWRDRDDAFLSVTKGINEVVNTLPSTAPVITRIELTLDESGDEFDEERFAELVRNYVRVDLKRITSLVVSGGVKILIEGDSEKLVRVVNTLRDPRFRQKISRAANLKSITYFQDQREYRIALGSLTLIEIVLGALRGFRGVKYMLSLAVVAAGVVVVAGSSSDYKIAVAGASIIFLLILGLVWSSYLATHSNTSKWSLALAWILVVLTTVISLSIFAGFFFGRGPLQAYFYSNHRPVPTPLPAPTAEASPTATTTTQEPLIVVTDRPPYDPIGGRNSKAEIAGKVVGARPDDDCIVIYSLTNTWYVQPTTDNPRTAIGPDGKWRAEIQRGTTYAVLLVPCDYQPPPTTDESPTQLPGVMKWMEIEGKKRNRNSR